MIEDKTYTLTDRELKIIIDYIRQEARLSYGLKRILWLTQEGIRIKNECLSLAENVRNRKHILRSNVSREIYNYIVDGDELDQKFPQTRLKKEVKEKELNEIQNNKAKKSK